MVLNIGDRVEVLGRGNGMRHSYYAATVVNVGMVRVMVVYETLHNEHGQPLVELLRHRRVRPYPARIDIGLHVGDVVDVWDRDGWWEGRIDWETETDYNVFFDYMAEGLQFSLYRKEDVRINQTYRVVDNGSVWSYWRP